MAGTRWFNLCTVKGLKTQFVLRYRCYFQSGARQSRICVAVTDFLNLDQLVRLNTRWLVHRMTIHTRRLKVIVPETNQHVKISLFSSYNFSINCVSVQSIHVTRSSCFGENPIHWAGTCTSIWWDRVAAWSLRRGLSQWVLKTRGALCDLKDAVKWIHDIYRTLGFFFFFFFCRAYVLEWRSNSQR